MAEVVITRYRTGFRLQTTDAYLRNALTALHETLTRPKIERSRGRVYAVPGDKFYIESPKEYAYYYIDALYDEVLQFIKNTQLRRNFPEYSMEINTVPAHTGGAVIYDRHKLNLVEPDDSDFVYQNGVIDFAKAPERLHTILEMQTGTGKTTMAMKIAVAKQKRLLVITKAAFVSKWLGDLKEDLNLRKGELVHIDSADALQDMIDIGKAGRMDPVDKGDVQIKAMAISSHALDKYIDNFLKYDGVETHPSEILKHLDVGLVLCDEPHMLFRMNYWSYTMLNIPEMIDTSATLVPDDAFLKLRYLERFPSKDRYDKLDFIKYIEAMGIMYGIDDGKLLRRVNTMPMYNHMMFEGLIFKSKKMQENYFKMCDSILEKLYFKAYQKGQKALVFFSTQQMCTEFAAWLSKKHPGFVVKRYIQGDKYDDMQKGDIVVSTPGKSGTAIDIKGLILSLSTVMIDDTQANLQMLGRTRRTKQWDVDVRMVYLFCRSLRKHMQYHQKRVKMYKGKVKNHLILNSSFMI